MDTTMWPSSGRTFSRTYGRTYDRTTMAATNEERYCVETRATIFSPERKFQYSEYVPDYFDGMDFFVGEVTMDRFNDIIVEPYYEEQEPMPTFVDHFETQTETFTETVYKEHEESVEADVDVCTKDRVEEIKVDASTNTFSPEMVNKVTGTDVVKFNMATSTDMLQSNMATSTDSLQVIKSHHNVATSTDGLHESSRSPSSTDEVDSGYWSANYSNLRRTLTKANNLQKETNDKQFLDNRSPYKSSKAIMTDEEISNVHSELNRLANERIDIIELLVVNIGNLSSSMTVELLEAKLNYSMGQTDQLLALLEESWKLESSSSSSSTSSSSHNKQMLCIIQKIVLQSRSELAESKRAIKTYLDEVKYILGDAHRRRALYAEIMRMKRRAEIEAFKLERMWEQLFYERTKKKESYVRSCLSHSTRRYPAPSREASDPGVDVIQNYALYLSDLRERNVLAAAEEELNGLRQQTPYMLLPEHLGCPHHQHHQDNGWETSSTTSTSSRSSYLSPRMHKDHLVELRRQIVASTPRESVHKTSSESSPSPDCFHPNGAGYKTVGRHSVK